MSLQLSGICIIAAMLFFYFRLIRLQRAKITLARQAAAQENAVNKAGGKPRKSKSYFYEHRFRIVNWYLLIGAIVLVFAGAFISTSEAFGELVRSLWWLPTAAGIVVGSFCFA